MYLYSYCMCNSHNSSLSFKCTLFLEVDLSHQVNSLHSALQHVELSYTDTKLDTDISDGVEDILMQNSQSYSKNHSNYCKQ